MKCFLYAITLLFSFQLGAYRYIDTSGLTLKHIEGTNRITVNVPIKVVTEIEDTHMVVMAGYDLYCPGTPPDSFMFSKKSSFTAKKVFENFIWSFGHAIDGSDYANGYPAKNAYASVLQNQKNITCTIKLKASAALSGNTISVSFGGLGFDFTIAYAGASAEVAESRQRTVTLTPPSTGGGGGPTPCPTLTPNMIPACNPDYDDPLIIDLGQDGINLGKANVGVEFDMYNTGKPNHIQWVGFDGNDAFLVRDLNNNDLIDNGQELFGNATPIDEVYRSSQDEIRYIPNGFIALAQYDRFGLGGNDDGYITADDQIWSQLQLWLDSNANGKTDGGELLSLEQFGISHLNVIPKQNAKLFDHAGNKIPLFSWASEQQLADHRFKMVDVFFKVLN